MPRIQIAGGFTPSDISTTQTTSPSVLLSNIKGHSFSLHAVSSSTIRVVHTLPTKFPQKAVNWESGSNELVEVKNNAETKVLSLTTKDLSVNVSYGENSPQLEWFDSKEKGGISFMKDSNTRAYCFDATSGEMIHYVERENHLPVSEDEGTPSPDGSLFLHPNRNEFVYGLGESSGTLEKTGKRFTMSPRDSLAYDVENGDPLYKVNPFYLVYNKSSKKWLGVFYNNLNDSSFDMGCESDVLFGCFRSYRTNCGPLDYYVMRGDGTLPSILTTYASLLSPTSSSPINHPIQASPTLPPLSQFGYLSSSLSLAAEPQAQDAIINFLKTNRVEGFPVDGLYLSSGWCEDEVTLDRNYFVWNKSRYPSPEEFGRIVEKELGVQLIVNIKPWLLSTHSLRPAALESDSFVKAPIGEEERELEPRQWVWSKGFGDHKLGNYFDYSGKGGTEFWGNNIKEELIMKNCSGMWIDNNEMAGLIDDEEMFRGEVGMWNATGVSDNVEKRMGFGLVPSSVGTAGKAVQTMGMARATYEAVLSNRPLHRPVIVSRSGVPGIQAYAHASWSGDNSTTWKALKWGTKMTLSVGMSFGPGLYGHDIGGFAGINHPSPELLVRWCQSGAWHSRFTVHSWKATSTTLYMYNHIPGITKILSDVLALRYKLAPTFYSLFVTDYQRKGHPILKPILWHHSNDPKTLRLDEEFLFGSHVLVAPVTTKCAITRSIYLPSSSNEGEENLMWCELDTGNWHEGKAEVVVLDAPLERTPVLVRAGGMLVLGGACEKNIYDGTSIREVLVFPSPSFATLKGRSGLEGSFTLIEDDGITNNHTLLGIYTELNISFRLIKSINYIGIVKEVIEIDYQVIRGEYKLPYDKIEFILPKGDNRDFVAAKNKELISFGKGRWGLRIVL